MCMDNDKLIERLSNLQLQEKALLRVLDKVYNDIEARTKTFNQIKKVKREISSVKFKIRLEKELKKNEKSR